MLKGIHENSSRFATKPSLLLSDSFWIFPQNSSKRKKQTPSPRGFINSRAGEEVSGNHRDENLCSIPLKLFRETSQVGEGKSSDFHSKRISRTRCIRSDLCTFLDAPASVFTSYLARGAQRVCVDVHFKMHVSMFRFSSNGGDRAEGRKKKLHKAKDDPLTVHKTWFWSRSLLCWCLLEWSRFGAETTVGFFFLLEACLLDYVLICVNHGPAGDDCGRMEWWVID